MRNIRSLVSVVLVVAAAPLLSACNNVEQQQQPKSRVSTNDALLVLEKILWPTYFPPEKPKKPDAPANEKLHEADPGAKDWHGRKRAEHPASIRHRGGAATGAQNRKTRESRISRRGRTTVIELNQGPFAEDIRRRVADHLGEKRLGNGRDPLVLLLDGGGAAGGI
jgi:hypothetical protein